MLWELKKVEGFRYDFRNISNSLCDRLLRCLGLAADVVKNFFFACKYTFLRPSTGNAVDRNSDLLLIFSLVTKQNYLQANLDCRFWLFERLVEGHYFCCTSFLADWRSKVCSFLKKKFSVVVIVTLRRLKSPYFSHVFWWYMHFCNDLLCAIPGAQEAKSI